MKSRMASSCGALLALVLMLQWPASSQERLKPIDPNKAHTSYTFPIHAGGKPLRFKVELSPSGAVTAAFVFRDDEAQPFQTLPVCKNSIIDEFTEYDDEVEFLEHSDLNFDGFEDVLLLQSRHPHLGTKIYCIYVWDDKSGRFRPAPEIPAVNPAAHPEDKTITVHRDWMGGSYGDEVYRWIGPKLELIESSGHGWGSNDPKCGFTDHCEKLIAGKMVTTLWRPTMCSDGREEPDLVCPANATQAAPNAPKKKASVRKK